MDDHPPSGEERARRKAAVDFARTNIELSGFGLTPEAEALNARFVAGELSDGDYLAAMLDHARSLPTGRPVQDYFTNLEELEAARSAADHDAVLSSDDPRASAGQTVNPVSLDLVGR